MEKNYILRKAEKKHFNAIFTIMKQSFPIDEYRPRESQRALFDEPKYCAYVLCDKDVTLGFITTWSLDGFVFVEHLAIDPKYRNCGLGAKILTELKSLVGTRLCLEVELPEDPMAQRRIAFYQRNGFFLNEYDYIQPAYSTDRSPIPLLIMTTDGAISSQEFESIKEDLYREVYRVIV